MSGDGEAVLAYETCSAIETQTLGRALSALLRPGDVVMLVGELGTGKTCFTQGVARGLGVAALVTSPTFTLMREYEGRIPLYHLDAYRLDGAADLFAIGVDEYADSGGVLVVEWGDRVRDFFDPGYLEISFEFAAGDDDRRISFMPQGGTWGERLREMPPGSEGHGQG